MKKSFCKFFCVAVKHTPTSITVNSFCYQCFSLGFYFCVVGYQTDVNESVTITASAPIIISDKNNNNSKVVAAGESH